MLSGFTVMVAEDKLTILIFDSGVGGLTIFSEIQQLLPHAEIIYASDNQAFPYGVKQDDELIARVDAVMHKLIEQCQPHVIVIACNSASTIALPQLRSKIAVPIVGVVPAIKPAAQQSQSKTIGLLATPATIRRTLTQQLINDFAADCEVIRVGSSELVTIAERKLCGQPVDTQALLSILAPFTGSQVNGKLDTLVLGCTHFPLLRKEIANLLPKNITLIDSGPAIAKQVERIILRQNLHLSEQLTASHRAIFTCKDANTERLKATLRSYGIYEVNYL